MQSFSFQVESIILCVKYNIKNVTPRVRNILRLRKILDNFFLLCQKFFNYRNIVYSPMFSDAIGKELVNIQEKHKDLINLLQKSSHFNREAVILQDYTDHFNLYAPWFQKFKDLHVSTAGSSLTEKPAMKIDHQSIPFYMDEIAQHPDKKIELLKEFFTTMPELNSADQQVLLNNFKDLPLPSLSQELENLATLFR